MGHRRGDNLAFRLFTADPPSLFLCVYPSNELDIAELPAVVNVVPTPDTFAERRTVMV